MCGSCEWCVVSAGVNSSPTNESLLDAKRPHLQVTALRRRAQGAAGRH
jgi:hypothetical protein